MSTFTHVRDMPASGLTQKQSASDSAERDDLRYTKIPLNNGSGTIPSFRNGTSRTIAQRMTSCCKPSQRWGK